MEGRYREALADLRKAEDAFRKLDARGHPFGHPLPNGVSGLANTLYMEGLCSQNIGEYERAVAYYETALINSPFEKRKPFNLFLKDLHKNLVACYEKGAEKIPSASIEKMPVEAPQIDVSYRFPFSLSPDFLPIARLYELAPDRYGHIKDFYMRWRRKDSELRRASKKTEDSFLKKMSIYVWGILVVIWLVYALAVIKALQNK